MDEQKVKEAIEFTLKVMKHTRTCSFTSIAQNSYECDCGVTEARDKLLEILNDGCIFEVGDRVLVKQNAGFHRGARGTIKYIQPDKIVWVQRDGASGDVWYKMSELEKLYL